MLAGSGGLGAQLTLSFHFAVFAQGASILRSSGGRMLGWFCQPQCFLRRQPLRGSAQGISLRSSGSASGA